MTRLLAAMAFVLSFPLSATAFCGGVDIMDEIPPAERSALDAATAAVPFPEGNLWRATREGAEVTLVGTYHLADPRHDQVMPVITPMIKAASVILVEAGPEEEKALMQAIGRDPGLMLITEGPSLLEQLGPEDWEKVSDAMSVRGMPGFMTAKFRPWYVSLMLGMPPCIVDPAALENGLDKRVIDLATGDGLPVRALEPYDTIFRLFAELPQEDQLNMIRSALVMEERAADFAFTLAEAYFAQDTRRMWEYMRIISRTMPGQTPETSDAEFARLEEVLINARNRAWIPVIEEAAAEGPVFVAFGALHLAGDEGVLNLLEESGWTLERLPL